MTKIKICGLKRLQDIEYVNELLPDFIGFVFAGTKRKITDEKAKEFKTVLNPRIKAFEKVFNIFNSSSWCFCK